MPIIHDFNFKEYLNEYIKEYDDKYSNIIHLLPRLYDLLSALLKSVDLPQEYRKEIYLTMGYLFYPDDVYPEEIHGPIGFIDDIMLILVVLKKIADRMGFDYLQGLAEFDYPIETLLEDDFIKLTKESVHKVTNLILSQYVIIALN